MQNRFPQNLKFLRRYFDITQQTLAEALQVSRSTVSAWERNVSEPSIGKVREVAEMLHIDFADLINKEISTLNVSRVIYEGEKEHFLEHIPEFRYISPEKALSYFENRKKAREDMKEALSGSGPFGEEEAAALTEDEKTKAEFDYQIEMLVLINELYELDHPIYKHEDKIAQTKGEIIRKFRESGEFGEAVDAMDGYFTLLATAHVYLDLNDVTDYRL